MDKRELRLGNWVQAVTHPVIKKLKDYKDSDYQFQVESIGKNTSRIGNSTFPNSIEIGDISPIPLDEGWLNRFGFKYSYDNVVKSKKYTLDSINLYMDDEGNCRILISEFKYVHQLQNLFFALTGNELQLKEK